MSIGKQRILVVEDEKPMAQALQLKLMRSGFEAEVAYSGDEALQLLEKGKFDLMLLDLIMPVMDGMTMLKKLREDVWGAKVPVIILTNLSADDAIIKGVVEDQPAYYLVKTDWKIADVVQKVRERLGM